MTKNEISMDDVVRKIRASLDPIVITPFCSAEVALDLSRIVKFTASERKPEKEALEFFKMQNKSDETMARVPREKIPEWLNKSLDCSSRITKEELFNNVLEMVQKKPTELNLRIAQLVLNEIGRFPDGMEFLMKKVTPKVISQFLYRRE